MNHSRSWLAVALFLVFLPKWVAAEETTTHQTAAKPIRPEEVEFFEKHIRPVLVEQCYTCHSSKAMTAPGGLRLDTAEALLRGGDSGPAIVPGELEESLLIGAIQYESFEMPPKGKLDDDTIAKFVTWVEMGAPDPRHAGDEKDPDGDGAHATPTGDEASRHWAFCPPKVTDPPSVKNQDWARTEIDRFILARLESNGLTPSTEASHRTLSRRLYYDLIGLPPTEEEQRALLDFDGDAAYAATVDRLLTSDHFGERWGRYWLDVSRYADTKGYVFQEDRNYPQAYTYRDWVIGAFNDDMPYDQFLVAQLAADQLDDPDCKPAAGFLTLGRRFINNQNDIIDDRIDVVSRGLMGLTVTCARCHDHKFDPVTMADYYALYGVFASCHEPHDEAAPLLMVDNDKAREPVIFIRGNPASRGPRVPRQFLAFLSNGAPKPFQQGSGRMEMAQAIANPENPLTARVWVNRVWFHLFGKGLVATPSDFGTRADPPSHPELLDWLAGRFMQEGWSTKWLIRQIVSSNVYRQSSDARPECVRVDPENRLFWRMQRRRLDLEALRDSMLVAAGRLDRTMGGPSVKLTEPPFSTRRTVYGFIERQNLPSMFRTFDFAGPDTHSPKRPHTTVPQQALFLMNSPFAMEQAVHLAKRAPVRNASTEVARIDLLFGYALGRLPSEKERAAALEFVAQDPDKAESSEKDSAPIWQYGWGTLDASTKRVAFHPLPHYTGKAWQGGADLPDPILGWVTLNATGGHPGNDPAHAAIRRWTAPRAGSVVVQGTSEHTSDQGDGIRNRLVSSRTGIVAEWNVRHGKVQTQAGPFTVEAGESLDLVTDCLSNPNFDGFRWTVTLRCETTAAPNTQESSADTSGNSVFQGWDSQSDFRGPRPLQLNRWERLAQVLLLTNEFAFID